MTAHTNNHRDYRLAIGFLAGTAIGAGLMMWLAPRAAAEVRQRVTHTAKSLGHRAQAVRDGVADGVARGAHRVEGMANAAKSSM